MQEKCLVQINGCAYGSTGTIMRSIHMAAQQSGWKAHMLCPNARENQGAKSKGSEITFVGSLLEISAQRKWNKRTGRYGYGFRYTTTQILNQLDEWKPDIIQLHNLHHHYVDLQQLFDYIHEHKIPVVLTLHDCWTFTGHCAHFTMNGCPKWQEYCDSCAYLSTYPLTLKDKTKENFYKKKKLFESLQKLVLSAPSQWIADLAKKSPMFYGRQIEVIHNGIDLTQSSGIAQEEIKSLRKYYAPAGEWIVLAVSRFWTKEKGWDILKDLATHLPADIKLLAVGEAAESQGSALPPAMTLIPPAQPTQLAKLYAAADVFVNFTREEVLGLVNVEALAAGTPVITAPTGGAPECIDSTSGIVLDENTWEYALAAIEKMRRGEIVFSKEACRQRASIFDCNKKAAEHIRLYQETCGG